MEVLERWAEEQGIVLNGARAVGTGELVTKDAFLAAVRASEAKDPDMPEEERTARLRTAVRGQVLAHVGLGLPVPGWLVRLQDEVENGG